MNYEEMSMAEAIAALKEAGDITVAYLTHAPEYGFYACSLCRDGSLGHPMGDAHETESEAWLSAAFRFAAYKPGVLQMTSREYGAASRGSAYRMEIRRMHGQYHVFTVKSGCQHGEEPKDMWQSQDEGAFATLGQAADHVERCIAEFEGLNAEYLADAAAAQRERDEMEQDW